MSEFKGIAAVKAHHIMMGVLQNLYFQLNSGIYSPKFFKEFLAKREDQFKKNPKSNPKYGFEDFVKDFYIQAEDEMLKAFKIGLSVGVSP